MSNNIKAKDLTREHIGWRFGAAVITAIDHRPDSVCVVFDRSPNPMDKYDMFRSTNLESVWFLTPPPQKPTKEDLEKVVISALDNCFRDNQLIDNVWDLFKDWIKESK